MDSMTDDTFIYIVGAYSTEGKMKTKVDKTASVNSAYFRFSFFYSYES